MHEKKIEKLLISDARKKLKNLILDACAYKIRLFYNRLINEIFTYGSQYCTTTSSNRRS